MRHMAKAIMIQGTASNSGKSLLTAGLCRIFKQDGYKVAPFKSQNMALNSFITQDGLEMARAQVMQAEACEIDPDIRMNPILLKPTSDSRSQVIVNGKSIGDMKASDYFAYKKNLIPKIMEAFESLSKENDIIVIEGAGSPAEINLKHDDIVNMGMATMAKSPVLIAGDIDRGGVFASLAGTMLLLNEDEKRMVKGFNINKFRGDAAILQPGLKMLEDRIKIPSIGIVPFIDIKVDDEDSLTGRFDKSTYREGEALLDIVVIRLPRISNFTDFNPLGYIDGVSLRYVDSVMDFKMPDLVILPGTKNTLSDLAWLRQSGLDRALLEHARQGKPVIGICGGYQMLGENLSDPHGVEDGGQMQGLGLLPYNTLFTKEKVRTQTKGTLSEVSGIFSALSGAAYEGYEIHMGITETAKNIVNERNVYGTYIHGIFDCERITKSILDELCGLKGIHPSKINAFDIKKFKLSQYDILADSLRKSLDMKHIHRILAEGL